MFARTSNVNAFVAAMNRLQNKQAGVPGMALVYGEPGLGKTRTAIWYAAQDSKVIYLRAKALMTPRWLLEELATELKAESSRRAADLFINCRQKLKEIPGVVLLVDEVDYLIHDPRMVETLRDLHDDAGAAVVMLGMGAAARELALDPATVSKIVNNRDAISGKRIMARVYKALRPCPALGAVAPQACAEHARFAATAAARMASNPDKQALYAACLKCKGGRDGK